LLFFYHIKMSYFIELQSTYKHPVMVNVEHIVYIEPMDKGCKVHLSGMRISSSDSGNNIRSVNGGLETLYVKESYETVKRKINE